MSMEYVIGCDIGSQAVKAVLVNSIGELVGEWGSGYGIDYPQPTWAEQPAEVWIKAIKEAVRGLMLSSGVKPAQVKAIGLDGQVDGVVAINAAGNPIRPALIWMDRRAVAQCDEVGKLYSSQRIYELSGLNLDASHVAPKIRWMADNQPELYRETAHFLLAGSYVAYFLTGELGVDYSNASSTLLMDVRSRQWSPELCHYFEIDPERLAPIYPATQDMGRMRSQVSEELGLDPHTRVILGSGDEHSACLGAGVVEPGLVCDIAGTAEPVCAASSEPLFDNTGLVETHSHADPDLWLLENPGFVSGANYRWFRDQFSIQEVTRAAMLGIDPYELLNQAAEKIPPGCEGLLMLPCLMGAMTPTWNALARGTFMGFTLAHTREHFVRAIMEASAFAVRDITDRMNEIGLLLKEIRIVGGGARSLLWRQIKADVCGLPVTITQTSETTALGAAILALSGSGLADSISSAVRSAVRVKETLQPRPDIQRRYEDYYQLYRATYFSLLKVFEQAASIKK
jgi:xylulokinase